VSSEDLYELLGVTRGTSGDEVRKAYRRLVREHHPDANPDDPGAEERFKRFSKSTKSSPTPRSDGNTTRDPTPAPEGGLALTPEGILAGGALAGLARKLAADTRGRTPSPLTSPTSSTSWSTSRVTVPAGRRKVVESYGGRT
jgi:DnaJ domain